jgi:hypothetical protein
LLGLDHVSLFESVGFFGREIRSTENLYLRTEHKHRINGTQISIPPVEYEPTTAVFVRAMTVQALNRVANVDGKFK